MTKRIFSIVLASVLMLTVFTACSSNPSSSTSSVAPSVSPSASPEASSHVTEESSHTSNVEGSEAVDGINGVGTTVDIKTIHENIKEVYGEDYIPDRELTTAEIEEHIGLTSDMYDEVFAEGSTLDENPDIYVAVKAKDGKVNEVEECLKNYKEKLLSDNKYEANKDKISAAQIHKEGDYVFLIMLGKNQFGEEFTDMGEAFKTEIDKGVNAIKKAFTA